MTIMNKRAHTIGHAAERACDGCSSYYRDHCADAKSMACESHTYEMIANDQPITLWDMAQAEMAEQRYTRACLDGQLRRGSHKRQWDIDG